MTTQIIIVSIVIFLIVFSLYKEFVKPVMVFVFAVTVLLITGVITPKDALSGFANEQIAVIFLLLILSDVIKRSSILDVNIYRLFRTSISYRSFMARMSFSVASVSAFVNNTPLVALMIPYVYEWSKRRNISPSKVLMPLSMAAIVGGTVTLIGTSTNLVVSGLAVDAGLAPIPMFAFTPIGLPIMIVCCLYITFFSNKLLPNRKDALSEFKEHPREYLVEVSIPSGSSYIGKTIADNNLRNLQGLYIVEIIRNNKSIAPVSPQDVIHELDVLMLAGDTETVIDLVNKENDLILSPLFHEPFSENVQVIEVVIAPNSSLLNKAINKSNFRFDFDAAIIAVNRNEEQVSGKLGDVKLHTGDLLLVVAGKSFLSKIETSRDLILVSKRQIVNKEHRSKIKWILLAIAAAFVLEATDTVSLFMSLFLITVFIAALKIITLDEIKKSLDIELLVMLALAIAIGKSISKSGADELFANEVIGFTQNLHPTLGALLGLYVVTNVLTMFVTNVAAVAITFPIALSMFNQMHTPEPLPYLLVIAFASSADFLTPFGYQTNLMIYGPGGYKFIDYIKYGIFPTFIYMALVIFGLAYWYNMI